MIIQKNRFLLYSPLNQGLKPALHEKVKRSRSVFTLQSIKSRIETSHHWYRKYAGNLFLLYSPLNQGLKPSASSSLVAKDRVFTLQSIKSRIETISRTKSCIG